MAKEDEDENIERPLDSWEPLIQLKKHNSKALMLFHEKNTRGYIPEHYYKERQENDQSD